MLSIHSSWCWKRKDEEDLYADATIARGNLLQLGKLDGEFESAAVAVASVGLERLVGHC